MGTRVEYLRVIGRLLANGQLRLRPCYLAASAPWSDREGEGDGRLQAQLLGDGEAILAAYPVRVYSTCTTGGRSDTEAVRAWIPFDPRTRSVRFMLRGRSALEIQRNPTPPVVALTWQPKSHMSGKQRITWRAEIPNGSGPVECFLRYSNTGGSSWQRIGWRTSEREWAVDFEDLPGGERCLIAVVATDGINTSTVHSEPFTVDPKACRAFIVSPVDGSRFEAGAPVTLLGQGYWMEEKRPERARLEWSSSRDGSLGCGARIQCTQLSAGAHRITLTAGDSVRGGSEAVTIYVAESARSADAATSAAIDRG